MQLSIPAKPDFNQIPALASRLTPTGLNQVERAATSNICNINASQLAFIVSLLASQKGRFETVLPLIGSFLDSKGTVALNELFELEAFLAGSFLKKFESQEAYSGFYSVFDKFYKKNIAYSDLPKKDSANGVLFFIHAPVFLAHTTPLFEILKSRAFDGQVKIATLRSNETFTHACRNLNVEHIVLSGSTLEAKICKLEMLASNFCHIVWQCYPAFLSYFSSRVRDVCWWSFKFNPPITGLGKCFTSLPTNVDQAEINGNNWVNFTPRFNLKNISKVRAPWKKRQGRVAAFCREELIDDDQYWSFLSKLLKSNSSLSFEYCGRSEIHSKWIKKYSINPNQVCFLGWLDSPEIAIREVAVVLDTYGLRHGLMAYEAAVASVPVAFPMIRESFGGIQGIYERLGIKPEEFLSSSFGCFTSDQEGIAMVCQLALDPGANGICGTKQNELFRRLPTQDFDALMGILQSKDAER